MEDHCRGIEGVLARGAVGEAYNIGGINEWANIDLVRLLCRSVDEAFARDASLAARFPRSPAARGEPCESLIRFVADRPGHDRRYAIDPRKAEAELGYRPLEDFPGGMRKTLGWYLANEAWWRAVLDGSYRR